MIDKKYVGRINGVVAIESEEMNQQDLIERLNRRVERTENALRDQALALSTVSGERDDLQIVVSNLRSSLTQNRTAQQRERDEHFDKVAALEHEIFTLKRDLEAAQKPKAPARKRPIRKR